MQPATFELIAAGNATKGDVIGIARIAAIQAAKRTAELIPLCHPIALSRVAAEFRLDAQLPGVHCTVTAETVGATGVEMEALTAVQIGLLTIYDMCKAADRGMVIERRASAREARRQVGRVASRPPCLRAGLQGCFNPSRTSAR